MNVATIDFEGKQLISVVVEPSRYFFDANTGGLLSWQIMMADGNVRDMLFCQEMCNRNYISHASFNIKTASNYGILDVADETLSLKNITTDSDNIIFSLCRHDVQSCCLNVKYRLSDLFFRTELTLENNGLAPVYWQPLYHVFLEVPWCDNAAFDRYFVKFSGKKIWTLSDSLIGIVSKKSNDKVSLSELSVSPIGVGDLRDSRICVCSPNEEECVSLIFGEQASQTVMAFRKHIGHNCLEGIFCSDIQHDTAVKLKNKELVSHRVVHSEMSDIFAVEVSAH